MVPRSERKKDLYELLKNEDGDLPYGCNVNEQNVLRVLLEIEANGEIDEDLTRWLEQWMVFNKAINEFESQRYKNRILKVHDQIKGVLQRAIKPKIFT